MPNIQCIKQYLERYAEEYAIAQAKRFIGNAEGVKKPKGYDKVVVIPAYNESTAFIRRLAHSDFQACESLLAVIVVNQPEGKPTKGKPAKGKQTTRLNQRLLDFLSSLSSASASQRTFAVLNYCQPGIPKKQGVGLARKAGCDFALYLIAEGMVKEPWIYCSDADAHLPNNYFENNNHFENNILLSKCSAGIESEEHPLHKKYSAISCRPKHQFTATQTCDKTSEKNNGSAQIVLSHVQKRLLQANLAYERHVFRYRDGLEFAQSPYAFLTFGSCLCINATSYAAVRGFPKRAGGEDFYLLNKLAKIKPVLSSERIIPITPRASSRVPFGTGPATEKYLRQSIVLDYDPRVFIELKMFLENIEKASKIYFSSGKPSDITFESIKTTLLRKLHPEACLALEQLDLARLIQHWQKQVKHSEQALKTAHDWFDAFRTLKFIHFLSETLFPRIAII